MHAALKGLGRWTPRHWVVAGVVTLVGILIVGVPTDLIDTPFFRRDVPPQWWSWPSLALSSLLIGLLAATYVSSTPAAPAPRTAEPAGQGRAARQGTFAGVLTFFAVGCPVCNKLVLLALGYAGALAWFQPIQPLLQLLAFALLVWALRTRLSTTDACPAPARHTERQIQEP